jgi:hypothetical protein
MKYSYHKRPVLRYNVLLYEVYWFYLYIKYEVLTLFVLCKNRTHYVPISLYRDDSYVCNNNDKKN